MLASCMENPYNDLEYYYGNYNQIETNQTLKDYSFLLKYPSAVRDERDFSMADINCDTLGEITEGQSRNRLFKNIVINGYYLYSSSLKVINAGNAEQPRMLKPVEYLSQIDTGNFRFFVNGELILVPGVRSFLVSEHEKDRYCETWLINTSPAGEIISAVILAKYKEYNGSCFFTEKITTGIKQGRVINLRYESSAFPTDAAYRNLKPYKKTFKLRLKITDTGLLLQK
jgi:hypothetical protein